MIRTFLALDLDERFLDDVAALAERLRGRAHFRSARWVRREVMHVTVRFFGETDDALVPRLAEAARALGAGRAAQAARGALTVRARGLGAFPDERHARVLVLLLEEPRGVIEAIANGAEEAAVVAGFAPEARPFRAHLTLARLREKEDVRAAAAATPVDLEGRVTSLALYASELGKGPGGQPLYTALERVSL